MVRIIWIFLLFLGLVPFSSAQTLADYKAPSTLQVPGYMWGVSYNGRYFSNVLEHWADLFALSRINRHWAVTIQAGVQAGEPGFLETIGIRWLPDGRIGRLGFENWVELKAGAIQRKSSDPDNPGCGNCDMWLESPIVLFTYGRDFVPWDKAHWGMRFSIFAGVAFGNALFRHETGIFGTDQTTLGWLMVGIEAGLFQMTMRKNEF